MEFPLFPQRLWNFFTTRSAVPPSLRRTDLLLSFAQPPPLSLKQYRSVTLQGILGSTAWSVTSSLTFQSAALSPSFLNPPSLSLNLFFWRTVPSPFGSGVGRLFRTRRARLLLDIDVFPFLPLHVRFFAGTAFFPDQRSRGLFSPSPEGSFSTSFIPPFPPSSEFADGARAFSTKSFPFLSPFPV